MQRCFPHRNTGALVFTLFAFVDYWPLPVDFVTHRRTAVEAVDFFVEHGVRQMIQTAKQEKGT